MSLKDTVFFENLSPKTFIVGIQHVFVMMGATVLVPILTGLPISVALFTAGIGTLLFHIFTKFKVPVFLGSSFSFIGAITAVTAAGMPINAALAGIVVAGGIYLIFAAIIKIVGSGFMHKLFPPQVTGPIIILIGIILAPVAVGSLLGPAAGSAGAYGWKEFTVAALTLLTVILVKIVFKKRFISVIPVLTALAVGFLVSIILGIVDYSKILSAAWIGIPEFLFPDFTHLQAYAIVVPIALVTIIEHFGDILAIGNVVGKDYVDDPGLHRTMAGDGLATSVAALIGGPANTTYSENTGTIALTGVKDPVVMRIAAIVAILLAFIPKVSSVIQAIPAPVVGGISILLFGMISAIGIKNMVDSKVDMGKAKNLIVVAMILVLGLGGASITLGPIALKGLGLAAIAGIILNFVLYIPENFFGKTAEQET